MERRPGNPTVVRKPRNDTDLARNCNEILHAHQFANGRSHLGHQARRERLQKISGLASSESRTLRNSPTVRLGDGGKGRCIMRVEDQTGDLVDLIRE